MKPNIIKNRLENGLYSILIKRLEELEKYSNPKSNIIRFPHVFSKICKTFMITKKQAWELLFFLNDIGSIKIVPYQGIKLNNRKKTIGEMMLKM